ncbi:MAG: capsular biosynthesis protein [Muribaculum sp.]|nr:capsular biosynthesis protein [Muribaculum sp.]
MWPFKKHVNTLTESGMYQGFTDWHSHILPGVDDGIKTLEDSLDVLRYYERVGVKKLWLTPHIMEDYPNTPADLLRRYEALKLAYDGPVEIKLASENMLDSLFEERLAENNFLPIGDQGGHLLIETSYFNPPMNMEELIEGVFKRGYFPVLAHPERYRYMEQRDYERLKEMGVLFQVNFVSSVGGYGQSAMEKVEWFLRKDMVDLVGSDLHRLGTVQKLSEESPRKSETLERLVEIAHNPAIE